MALHLASLERSNESFWKIQNAKVMNRYQDWRPLMGERRTDVVVVGAGVTGLSTALELAAAGKSVIVLEARTLGMGTSGATSAHVTYIPDMGLASLIKDFGFDDAKKLLRGLRESFQVIRSRAAKSVKWKTLDALLIANDVGDEDELAEEHEAARSLGIQTELLDQSRHFWTSGRTLKFPSQGQFDPICYLNSLVDDVLQNRGEIFFHSPVTDFDEAAGCVYVVGESFQIKCRHLVLATHSPLGKVLSAQTRMIPYLSYLIAARPATPTLASDSQYLVWDTAKPYHYIRSICDENGPLLLFGGADKKVGRLDSRVLPYRSLRRDLDEFISVKSIDYHWDGEFFEPADGLPFIGHVPFSNRVFIATGYSGTGLTFGSMAGRLLRDQILDQAQSKPLLDLLKPSRLHVGHGIREILDENASFAKHLVVDRLLEGRSKVAADPQHLRPEEGAILREGSKLIAAYRDRMGNLHYCDATCTHAACIVKWNHGDKTWDCPCHGARFSCFGKKLEGPALKDLKAIEVLSSTSTMALASSAD